MLRYPTRYPDETLYSLLARIATLNGLPGLEVIRALLGGSKALSILDSPVNLSSFAEITNGIYGTSKIVLFDLTTIPLRANLGEVEGEVLSKVIEGSKTFSLAELVFGAKKGARWKLCAECVEEDTLQEFPEALDCV